MSVIVPMRNEEAAIAACLAAVGHQDYSPQSVEVIVVDGSSDDNSDEVARAELLRHEFAGSQVIQNPVGSTPSSLNLGLSHAQGEFICRVDARSLIPTDYVSRCVGLLRSHPELSVVGGMPVPSAPDGAGAMANAIARALRNPYAMGFARYKRGASSGPADTVYLGFFRTDDLREVDGWDERFLTNQDFELNQRMRKLGIVWFEVGLRVGYVPRTRPVALWQHYRKFGRWKAASWLEGTSRIGLRHMALLSSPLVVTTIGVLVAKYSIYAIFLGSIIGVMTLDAAVREPAPLRVRLLASAVTLLPPLAWFCGLAEQLVRRIVRKERLFA